MDYIYLIINYDANEVEYATTDLDLAQEIVSDMYTETLYEEFNFEVNRYNPSTINAYCEAKETIDSWFRDYVAIEKVPLTI